MSKHNTILIVDDSEINRAMLTDILSADYDIVEAANGLEAVAYLNQHYAEISLVLLDIVMPEMDGFDVLAVMNRSKWIDTIPVIMISAETASMYIEEAYNLGAAEYISRPFDENTVRHRVKNTIILYSKQKYLEEVVTDQILEKERSNLLMVTVLSHIVEFRNGESGMHVLHIRIMTEALLRNLTQITDKYHLTTEDILQISHASAMHDIGKIAVPEEILNKPGRLTPEERQVMMTHSAIGAEMLEKSPYYRSETLLRTARDICRWHHERYDGGGYPDGLVGDEIPIAAQVVSLADVYDALTSTRVYKPAYTHEQAMEMILNGECGVFNPILLECLQKSGEFLKEEMKLQSTGEISQREVRSLAKEAIQERGISNRTLALLEQERIKYEFFASMAQEIQFEYSCQSEILTFSAWGAAQWGIPMVIAKPEESEQLKELCRGGEFTNLQELLSDADDEDPIMRKQCVINTPSGPRQYELIARPLWVGTEHREITGYIGKCNKITEI